MKYSGLTTQEKIEMIIREHINQSTDLEDFIRLLTLRILELTQDEIKYGRKD